MHKLIVIYILFAVMFAHPAVAREQIRAVGSSTVYPFVTVAAEQFGQGGKFKTPIIESTGTGGGFKLFCEGIGEKTPDISNASRPITDSEKELCAKNGVLDILEIKLGYDGIVLAAKKGTPVLDLSKKAIFLALARELPDSNGKMQKNPYKTWHEIDDKLPDNEIEVYGPPPTSGTRDAFVELAMEKGCELVPEFAKAYSDAKIRKKQCTLIREDGKFVEAGEDDNVIVQKLFSNEKALGILGYSFVEENVCKVQSSKVQSVFPNFSTIESGEYGVSRSLYVYVKLQHIRKISGITEFIKELTSENAIGGDGYVIERGLLPLRVDERVKQREIIKIKMSEYGKI
jgi:phosphate transport system substrate-binding protein